MQTIIPLGANGAIRLTTARYYTPSNRSIQAKGIDPDIWIEQELPEELKKRAAAAKPRGEASLRGHLKNKEKDKNGKEVKERSGSSAYVPKEPEKDTQLQYALSFLRGTATDAKTAGSSCSIKTSGSQPSTSRHMPTSLRP